MYKSQGRQESIFFFFLNEAHVTMIKHREVGVLRFFFVFFFPFVWSGGGVCVCFFFFFGGGGVGDGKKVGVCYQKKSWKRNI